MRSVIVAFALILGGTLMANAASSVELTLAKNGKSDYTIVVSKNASLSEQHAAKELQGFLKEISGADLPVTVEDGKLRQKRILIGEGDEVHLLPTRINFAKLGNEGFHIETVGSDLVIAGGRQRGTMYGVYAFLEEVLGCRWYSSKVSRIPKKNEIVLGALNITETPAFEYREPLYTDAHDAEFAARNRLNSHFARLDKARGGRVAYGPSAFVHTFYGLVPPATYFKDHPEYYSLINGKRTADGAQLCLTNPDVLRIATEQVLKWIQEAPDAVIFSVSQNDCDNPCQCEACRKIVEEEGSESGPLLRFVNAIAKEVGKKYPDKLIDTLAYRYTKDPPKKTVPASNVRIRLCPIENCVAHPFEKCPQNAHFVSILKRWNEITDNLYIWHYNTNFGHYLIPFPNWDEIAADVPLYERSGVKGLFMQGNYSPGGGGEFDELRAYVIAKLLWNPATDPWKTMDDFLDGYYDKAGRPLRKYINLLMSRVRDKDVHTGIYNGPEVPYLAGDFLPEANKYFDEAEKAVADDPAALERVRHARLSIRYVETMFGSWWKGKNEVNEPQVMQFAKDCKEAGITNISESWSVDNWVNQCLKR